MIGASTMARSGRTLGAVGRSVRARSFASVSQAADAPRPRQLRRFYRSVSVEKAPHNQYTVKLDSRTLRTPAKAAFAVPTEQVAVLVASEWEAQQKYVEPHTMPIMSLCATAIDQIARNPADNVEHLLPFLENDTVCLRDDSESPLRRRQEEAWDPLVEWVTSTMRVPLTIKHDLFTSGQPEETVDEFRSLLRSQDAFTLAGLNVAASSLKSLVLAIGLLRERITAQEAVTLARVEEDMQAELWGFDELFHGVDVADTAIRVASASILFKSL